MNEKRIKVTAKPSGDKNFCGRGDFIIKTTAGDVNLGGIQSLKYEASVDAIPSLELVTIMNEVELEQLQENTTVKVSVEDQEAYDKGYNSKGKNTYPERSYGHYLFELARKDVNERKRNKENKL